MANIILFQYHVLYKSVYVTRELHDRAFYRDDIWR